MFSARGGGSHHGDQRRPIDLVGAAQILRPRILQARTARCDQHVTAIVKPPAAGAPEHLQEFLGQQVPLEMPHAVARVGHQHAAQGKIDAGGEPGRGDDRAELAGFGKRLDQSGARGVAQAAMVKGDAFAQQFGEFFPSQRRLLGGKRQRIVAGQSRGEFAGQVLAGGAARAKNEDRRQFGEQGLGNESRPVAVDGARVHVERQPVEHGFFQRHGPFLVDDEFHAPIQPREPGRDRSGLPTLPLRSRSWVPGGARARASS